MASETGVLDFERDLLRRIVGLTDSPHMYRNSIEVVYGSVDWWTLLNMERRHLVSRDRRRIRNDSLILSTTFRATPQGVAALKDGGHG